MTTDELFDNYKCYIQLEEGPGEYLVDEEDFKKAMIEFAKYHVQKALESAFKTHLSADNDEWAFDKMGEVVFSEEAKEYNENQLLTCYLLENIK